MALFAVLVCCAGGAFAANDFVLWFMVDDTAKIDGVNISVYNNSNDSNAPDVNAARLHVTGDGVDSYLNLAYLSEDGKSLEYFSAEDGAPAIATQVVPLDDSYSTGWTLGSLLKSGTGTTYTQFRFAVELGFVDFTSNDGKWTAIASSAAGYEEIKSHITAVENSVMASMVKAWAPTDYSPIPEPSGGMLLLFGTALLALRRKRA